MSGKACGVQGRFIAVSLGFAALMVGHDAMAQTTREMMGSDEGKLSWINPFHDPLGVLPPSSLESIPLPPDMQLEITEDCARVDAMWSDAPHDQIQEMRFQDALDLAVCRNPELSQSKAEVQASAAALGQIKAAALPSVSAGVSRTKQVLSYPDDHFLDERIYATTKNIGATWQLFDFGQQKHKELAQARLVQASLSRLNAAARKVVLDVAQYYFAAQSAAALKVTKDQVLVISQQILRSVMNRADKGMADQSDVLQARSGLARAEYDASVSQGDAEKARAALSQVLGTSGLVHRYHVSTTEVELVLRSPEKDNAVASLAPDLEQRLEDVQSSHPAIAAARAQVESAQQTLLATRLEAMPTVDISWNQYDNGRPNQTLTAMSNTERTVALNLHIPIFDGFAQTYKVRAAQAQLEQKKAELGSTEAQVLKDTLYVFTDARAAISNLTSAQKLAVAAQLATESIKRKYDQGAADLVQLNQSLIALEAAKSDLVKSWTEWQSARLRLVVQMGTTL